MRNWILKKNWNYCLFFLALSTSLSSETLTAKASWNWSASPQASEWKEFQKLSYKSRSSLWKEINRSPLAFEKMAWEWRLAWVQTCGVSVEAWCSRLMQESLFDKALVVRAETAVRLGERFAGTGHKTVLRILSTAYAVQQNSRSTKPLYVQYRILHAIKQIGGPGGLALGERLAANSPQTSRYWQLLSNQSRSSQEF